MNNTYVMNHQLYVLAEMLELYEEDKKDYDMCSRYKTRANTYADRKVTILEVKVQGHVYRYTSEWIFDWNCWKHVFYFSKDGNVVPKSTIDILIIKMEEVIENENGVDMEKESHSGEE